MSYNGQNARLNLWHDTCGCCLSHSNTTVSFDIVNEPKLNEDVNALSIMFQWRPSRPSVPSAAVVLCSTLWNVVMLWRCSQTGLGFKHSESDDQWRPLHSADRDCAWNRLQHLLPVRDLQPIMMLVTTLLGPAVVVTHHEISILMCLVPVVRLSSECLGFPSADVELAKNTVFLYQTMLSVFKQFAAAVRIIKAVKLSVVHVFMKSLCRKTT